MRKNLSGASKTAQRFPAMEQPGGWRWFYRHRLWFAGLGLVLVVVALYIPSLEFKFILDDHRFTADPRIQNSGHLWEYLTSFVWAQFTGAAPSFYRPVFLMWMRLNYLINGMSAWGWHLFSIVKHAVVAALVGMLAWKLLRDFSGAILAALLFALHPAQTESVSWVTVPDPLMAAAVLCSLYLYYKHVSASVGTVTPARKKKSRKEITGDSSSLRWLTASVVAYFAALLAKETAVIMPAIILALGLREASEVAPEDSLRTKLKKAILDTVPFLVATGVYLLLRVNALNGQIATTTQHLLWKTVLLSWPATLWFYLKVMLWPTRSYAFADPVLIHQFSVQAVLLPLSLVLSFSAVVAGLILWTRRVAVRISARHAADVEFALISGTLLLFLPLLPALNLNALNPGDFLHGRYTYLPLCGVGLIAASVCNYAGRMRIPALALIAAIAFTCVPLTLVQQRQWKDDLTVFTVAHELAPYNAPVAKNLADARVRNALLLEEDGHCPEATPVFQQVSREYPDDWYALAGLGYCAAESNDFAKAEDYLHRAADLSHDSGIIQQWQEMRTHMGLPPLQPGSK